MRYINEHADKRPVLFCLTIITILLLAENQHFAYAQETLYENLAILLNNVKSAKYSYSDSDGESGEIGYRILGEETESGEATWKVEWKLVEEGEKPDVVNLWISKSTGRCLKAEIEGETYTGYYAELFGNVMLYVWFAWVGTWIEAWNFTTVYGYTEAGYGRLSFLGSETRTYGPSQLYVYKYRWEGYTSAPTGYRGAVEWWFAPVQFGTIVTRVYSKEDREWFQLELSSIELVSPQPRPNIVVETKIDKKQLKPNEEATLSITASNTGNALGTHNLTVTVGGAVKKSWLIVLNPGESKSLSHKLSFTADGSYAVSIGDQTVTITVSTVLPARFEVSSLNINPSSVRTGQSTTISVSVKNTGGESGSYEVTLKVNNQAVETKTGTLSPDQSTTVSFTYTPQTEGTYSIDVNGLTGSLAVSREAAGLGLGISTEMLIIIVVVVAVVVVLAALLLRRKPKPQPTYVPQPTYPPPPPPPSS